MKLFFLYLVSFKDSGIVRRTRGWRSCRSSRCQHQRRASCQEAQTRQIGTKMKEDGEIKNLRYSAKMFFSSFFFTTEIHKTK